MEQVAKIDAYITIPDCTTTGTVKGIKEGSGGGDRAGSDVGLRD